MGVARATWLSRGLQLPRRGSPGDLVLRGLLERERSLKISEMSLMVRFMGLVAGVERKNVDAALELYLQEITHMKYGPDGAALTRKILDGLKHTSDDLKARVDAVAALSYTEKQEE